MRGESQPPKTMGSMSMHDSSRVRLRRWQDRVQWAALLAPLLALVFVQRPGWIIPDTKLDLTANPGGFLVRALTMWDPLAAGGQVQNQAYGYLFPMGPFFWLGSVIGLPPWVTQRLWWALVLGTAFVGMRLLLTRLGVGSLVSRIAAAYAYALAPRMLMGLGAISSEIWPMALAPWVMIPLVRMAAGGERAVAFRSGIAVLMLGAVNAAATLAALVPAGLWILTRHRHVRWRLAGWWSLAVLLACLWWIGPLLLMGAYSAPFLNWIETASVTTQSASLTEASRGTTQWLAGLVTEAGPLWPSGFEILTQRPAILLGLIVVVIGLLGVWWARGEWALFVRTSLIVGLVLVTFGHSGALSGAFSSEFGRLLDGILVPFRNTHKFEPVVRIALVLGLAHALPRIQAAARLVRAPWPRLGYFVVAVCLVGQAASPAIAGVSQRGPYLAVPDYWQATARYLEKHDDGGRTLVLPGINGVSTIWGSPRDEPLQPLARSPWITRDGVPLGSASATRLLNEMESRVATGQGGPALRDLLDRLAISKVVLRSDLAAGSGEVPTSVLRRSLVSAGLESEFLAGPLIGAPADVGQVYDFGLTTGLPAVEVLSVSQPESILAPILVPAEEMVVVTGGPEGVLAAGVEARVAVVSSDTTSVEVLRAASNRPPPVIVTDTLQRRTAHFGDVRDSYGPLMTGATPYPGRPAQHDWLPAWLDGATDPHISDLQTTADPRNGPVADASSALTVPAFTQGRDLSAGPERAFDVNRDSAWASAGFDPVGEWVETSFPSAVDIPTQLDIVFDMENGAQVSAVDVTTAGATVRTEFAPPTSTSDRSRVRTRVAAHAGPSTFLRVAIVGVHDDADTVRIRDIGEGQVPRTLIWRAVPTPPPSGAEATLSFEALTDRRPLCLTNSDSVVVCNPVLGRAAEESGDLRRMVNLPQAGVYRFSGTALPFGTPAANRLLQPLSGMQASAESTWIEGPWVGAPLAIDGDLGTFWAAAPEGPTDPILTLTWGEKRVVNGVALETAPAVIGRRATRVAIELGDDRFVRGVPPTGTIPVPAREASSMRIEVLDSEGPDTLTWKGVQALPIVVGEVVPRGPEWPEGNGRISPTVEAACGFGPALEVNGQVVPTRAGGSRDDFIAGEPMSWEACESVSIPSGPVTIRVLASGEFEAATLLAVPATPVAQVPVAAESRVTVGKWSATHRELGIAGVTKGDSFLVVRENANAGWVASLGGEALKPITVDGWAQGWLVPAGSTGSIDLSFAPQRAYVGALVAGAVAALVLLGLALRRWPGGLSRILPAADPSPLGRRLAVMGAAVVLLGWVGAIVLILAAGVRRLRWDGQAAVFTTVSVAWVVWAAWQPWPSPHNTNRDVWSQVLALSVIMVATLGTGGFLSRPSPHGVENRTLQQIPTEAGENESDQTGHDESKPESAGE